MKIGDKVELPCGASAELLTLDKCRNAPEKGLAVVKLRDMVHTRLYHETGQMNPTLELRFLAESIPGIVKALQAIERELCPKTK